MAVHGTQGPEAETLRENIKIRAERAGMFRCAHRGLIAGLFQVAGLKEVAEREVPSTIGERDQTGGGAVHRRPAWRWGSLVKPSAGERADVPRPCRARGHGGKLGRFY